MRIGRKVTGGLAFPGAIWEHGQRPSPDWAGEAWGRNQGRPRHPTTKNDIEKTKVKTTIKKTRKVIRKVCVKGT